jgi:hypothetical protein
MNNDTSDRMKSSNSRNDDTGGGQGRFVLGLAAGTMIGVGVGLWLSPRASTLRQWLDESTHKLGTRASEQYEEASVRVTAVVDGLTGTAQGVRDGLADTVARGAQEVERLAKAAKS